MNFTEELPNSGHIVNQYQSNVITINHRPYPNPILLTIDKNNPWQIDEITQSAIQKILPYQPEIVIIGTGETQIFIHPEILSPLINQQIGVEVMSTRMACQTFNVLQTEGRNVLAALIP